MGIKISFKGISFRRYRYRTVLYLANDLANGRYLIQYNLSKDNNS
ncbi:hypothetical protein QWY77_09710 [Thalassotalea ponticola]|nr:hypothetical protein [Thalassotalea ponticola]MDN3653029.1 hypothetical protein [Thalassotalea ponticola]